MAEGSNEGTERDAEDTDELFYTELEDNSSMFELNPPPLKLDHCDLLLDAIDAQLIQLQVQNRKQEAISRKHHGSDAAPLRWSQSVSKDTGLGSTTQTNDIPISCLDFVPPETRDQTPERSTGYREGPAVPKETEHKMDERIREEEGVESRREQCIWRLERLLGDACSGGGLTGEQHPPSDSICTEDFDRCFREEMVALPLSSDESQPRPDKEEESGAENTEVSDRVICLCDRERKFVLDVRRRETETQGCTNRDTENSHNQQPDKQGQREEVEKPLSDRHGMRISSRNAGGVGERYKAPDNVSEYSNKEHCLPSADTPLGDSTKLSGQTCLNLSPALFDAKGSSPSCSSNGTGILTEPEGPRQNKSPSPKARSLAGVPVWSFDTVSIDSDLDSVCTQQVRQHIQSRPGWRSVIQSVRDMSDLCTDQSGYDTPTQEPSKPGKPVLRSSHGNVRGGSPPLHRAQHNRRDTSRCIRSLGEDDDDDDEDTDEGHNHRSRRRRPDKTSADQLEEMKPDWVKTEEQIPQKRDKEEERLKLKGTRLSRLELFLSDVQQKREHALQEVARLRADTAQMEREKQSLEASLRESRAEADSTSCHLRRLQKKRDSCLHEVRAVEEELATLCQRRMAVQDGTYVEKRQTSVIVSVLEREEMERQLDSTKTELFAEQRRSRDKLDSMQEKLEETCEELHRVTEEESSLRSRCAGLEEKHRQKQEQTEALEFRVRELQGELGDCKDRLGSLEKSLAQKELQLLGVQEEHGVLQAQKSSLQGELQSLKQQHCTALREAQEHAHRAVETELEQLNKDLALAHEQQIQKVYKQAEEAKAIALREQAVSLTWHIESIQSSIQLKEEEARKLKESLEQQKEVTRKREEEMRVEASEKVHKAIEHERRKWEAEKAEAVQVHCGKLEEQNRESLERVRSEMEREKRNAMALQKKAAELQTRVQELEGARRAQQREQESALAVTCNSLKEEHRAKLQNLRRHVEQESQRKVLKLEQTVQLAEEEANRLRMVLGEKESCHKKAMARLEQQLRHWAQELGAECQQIVLILEQNGARGRTVHLPHSPTAAETLKTLQGLREQLQHFISHLHQELDSQMRTAQQMSRDKERELRIQMEMERDQALDSLKERLIQEHVEELSSLNRAQLWEGGEGGGVAASLRRQLQAKDQELRQVQRSMGQWKEQTAARLARKFEEELTAELERCKAKLLKGRKTSKAREEKQRKFEKLEGEIKVIAKECSDYGSQCSALYPFFHAGDSAASPGPSDMASFKLLHHLQSRIKQLRAENQAYACSTSPLKKIPYDLSGSYLETITQSQDGAQILSHSSIRTVPS